MDKKHLSMIEKSWQRCREAGLLHNSNPIIEMETGHAFAQSLDEHSSILATTQQKKCCRFMTAYSLIAIA
ncbi:hypothetical protein QW180_05330 [Vibrio sinaloensis]|nr:hypothetical protein [Vibrio sinaloensis]